MRLSVCQSAFDVEEHVGFLRLDVLQGCRRD